MNATHRTLSRQAGGRVIRQGDVVKKTGNRVRPCEAAALQLVQQHTSVPVPVVLSSSFADSIGTISMAYVEGDALDKIWPFLEGDEEVKEDICRQTWDLIYKFRGIPKPLEFPAFQCCADGTASTDVLIKPLPNHDAGPLASDVDLRERIYERYYEFNGRRYGRELLDMLPRSEKIVFTHADITPRNIIVDKQGVVGIVDWEEAGWYPDYWEYANIMKPSDDCDWQRHMVQTAPEKWDLSGIVAARRVLF